MPDPRVDAILAGMADYLNDSPPDTAKATAAEIRTYKALKDAANKPVASTTGGLTVSQGDQRYAQIQHGHSGKVDVV